MPVPATAAADLTGALQRVLAEADRPVSFAALKKKLRGEGNILSEALQSALRSGTAWRWPDHGASRQRYWSHDPARAARDKVSEIAAAVALSQADLIKRAQRGLPGYPEGKLKALVREMIAEKQLRAYPGIGAERGRIGASGVPQAYINAANEFIAKKLKAAGIGTPEPTPGRGVDLKQRILDAMRAIEPTAGLPVSTKRLRQHESLGDVQKGDFDRAVLELRLERQVSLDRHVDPYNLSQEDRDQLIFEENGLYYVAASLRTDS